MNRTWWVPVQAALALACTVPAFGQESDPIITDRPTFSAAAFTVAPAKFQFEMGYTFTESGDEERQSFGELLARIGVLPWLEGRLGFNSFVLISAPTEAADGLQDLNVAAKAIIFRRPEGSSVVVPQVALMAGVDLPTGTGDAGGSEVQPGARVLLHFDLTDRLIIGSNVGWAYLEGDGARFNQGSASLGSAYSISSPVSVFVEWYGLFPENRGGGSNHYVNGGLAWGLGPNVQLDWRIGLGLQEPDPNWLTGVGVSFRL